MDVPTFGAAIGRLVYQKRKALGLTQTQLAEDAFQSAGKTRRISELENGTVANPHPKTIDPLINYLGITDQEIENCAKQANSQPDQDLDRAYREARNMIEAIARQFEHTNPNATLSELDEFLRNKASEWVALRSRISSIEARDNSLTELKSSANESISEGEFADADNYLSLAEELQKSISVLDEVSKLVELRIARAEINMLADKPDIALEQYLSAVDFLLPFSEAEALDLIQKLAHERYEIGRRSINPNYAIPATLLEKALKLEFIQNDKESLERIHYRLSLIYRGYAGLITLRKQNAPRLPNP